MKLLTLNTHSLIEENYPQKLALFADAVAKELPDVIALQEVNQTADAAAVDPSELIGYTACEEDTLIRADNHVYNAAKLLAARGIDYHWTWLPIKKSYGRYEEGLALMSLSPILDTDSLTVSETNDFQNWKRRKLLGIRSQNADDEWFFSVHYGWWGDADEPFAPQWQRTSAHMKRYGKVWLMGDFNSPAEVRNEGYDLVARSGWLDSYTLAEQRDSGVTVTGAIDGWRAQGGGVKGMRIDQIWVNRPVRVVSSKVIFDRAHYPIISDHCGVIVNYERRQSP